MTEPVTYKLVVTVPGENVFEAYWYGYGVLVGVNQVDAESFEAVVDYGTDKYHAECQQARFASGLYFAEIITSNS